MTKQTFINLLIGALVMSAFTEWQWALGALAVWFIVYGGLSGIRN